LRAPTGSVAAILARHGLNSVSPPDYHDLSIVSQSDNRTAAQVVAELQQDPDVQAIETQYTVNVPELASSPQLNQSTAAILDALSGTTPVPYFGNSVWSSYVNQTAAGLIRVSDSHVLATGIGVVAVVDTGVDPNHPLLQGSLVPGYDFVNETPFTASEWSDVSSTTSDILGQPTMTVTAVQVNQSTAAILDQSTAAILDTTLLPGAFGHGTMVAGIIHLVAPTAQIMPLKAFRADGSADLSDIVRAIYFAVDNGARVINMSFSMSSRSTALAAALAYATAHGVVCVASVGNEGIETRRYPASYPNVIGVASTDNLDARSIFSNYGEGLVEITAPGEGIVTAYPGGHYAVASGTSFSAPLVSGAMALMLQMDMDLNQYEATQGISSAKRLGGEDLGFGRLDIFLALSNLNNPHH
jgi:subtilisin family serine protease